MSDALPAIYLAAGEGKRLRPLTDELPKAMLELGGMSLAERAIGSLRATGIDEIVAVTGHAAEALGALGSLVDEQRFNPRFADTNNVYSLWMSRDVVERGCFIVNSDVLFERGIADRLVTADGSAVLCASDHRVDGEAMKAVVADDRLTRLSKGVPGGNPEYIGLTRIDPEHGPRLAAILDDFVTRELLDVYYEDAIELLAQQVPVSVVFVDGLAWIEIDDHGDLTRARDEILERVA